MEKEFIPYEEALTMKELGFDDDCLGYYVGKDREIFLSNEHVPLPIKPSMTSKVMFRAPLYQQAFKWFKTNYNLFFSTNFMGYESYYVAFHLDTEDYRHENMMLKNACYSEIVDIHNYDNINLEIVRELIRLVKSGQLIKN